MVRQPFRCGICLREDSGMNDWTIGLAIIMGALAFVGGCAWVFG